jgi:hypothetical protein
MTVRDVVIVMTGFLRQIFNVKAIAAAKDKTHYCYLLYDGLYFSILSLSLSLYELLPLYEELIVRIMFNVDYDHIVLFCSGLLSHLFPIICICYKRSREIINARQFFSLFISASFKINNNVQYYRPVVQAIFCCFNE